jgi:hypothetical protein
VFNIPHTCNNPLHTINITKDISVPHLVPVISYMQANG